MAQYFSCLGGKSANCGLLWGKCNHACYYCRCLWFHCICFSAVTGLLLIFLWPKLLVIVVPLYLIRFSAVTILLLTCPWRKLLIESICNWGHPGVKLFLFVLSVKNYHQIPSKKKPHILWKSKKSNLSTTAVVAIQKSRSYIHFNWLKFTNLGREQQSCCTCPHLNRL